MSKDKEVVAKRYASALFEVAQGRNALDQVEKELVSVKSVIQENKQLLTILNHPKISSDDKKAILSKLFGNQLSEAVHNTLLLMVDRKRETMIPNMVEQYIKLANEERGVADATVYSVRILTEEEQQAISKTFAERINVKELRVENVIDQDLVGGIKVKIGNRIFDGSVSGKLNRIQRQLVSE
ncbi:F0F1 ATP synthase subunit delta [Pseudalkalibacillus salsuginis]|uniref:F0F1 ATP synthase subunit delta n=1 Tax=Pseudalkalibacillus salsuginis TaxID=2910972 RepID=UPI001F3E6A34|nr:F0F1 ATP synthase subunit delta [Pseudalkalibacillus salsuginis]MCF6410928.1 F0F1 ATP synthase subunit delta [Pseudalkalibacillus salsuginis]